MPLLLHPQQLVTQTGPPGAFRPSSGNTITWSMKLIKYQVLGSGYKPSNSWQRSAGCVGAWRINLPPGRTAGLLSTTHSCTGNRENWNRVVRNNIKTPMYELRVPATPPNLSSRWSIERQSFWAKSIIIFPQMGQQRQNIYQAWNRIFERTRKISHTFSFLATSDALTALWRLMTWFLLKEGMKKCLVCH